MEAGAARAEQFVLFDVTFSFTKQDADDSRPSKSHYYVKGDALNPKRPRDWTRPVDYRNGTVHVRIEVLDRPASGEGTQWSLCYIPNRAPTLFGGPRSSAQRRPSTPAARPPPPGFC